MKKSLPLIALFGFFASAISFGAPSDISLAASGGAFMPLGVDAAVFGAGFGGRVGGDFAFAADAPLRVEAGLGYAGSSVLGSGSVRLSSLTLEAGLSLRLLRFGPFSFAARAAGGGYFASLSDGSGTAVNPALEAGIDFSARLGSFRPFLRVSYATLMGLAAGVDAAGGIAYSFGGKRSTDAPKKSAPAGEPRVQPLIMKRGPANLEVVALEIEPLFPIFFRYYDTHGLGYVEVRNAGRTPIEGLRADFLVKQFMDDPKECAGPASIAPGEIARIPLYALFNDKILGVSEGNKVSGTVSLSYISKGKPFGLDLPTAVVLYDRNATSWADDRRAAAFVTAKDPVVLKFAKNAAGFIEDSRRYGLPNSFASAMSVFESLRMFGMRYVIDPNASYASVSEKKDAVDFIQFPRQSLDFKAGDCDDLSVLSAALLEALGAKSAFVTVPGHIFVAVDLELSPDEARRRFAADELIIEGGRVWLPFEITALSDDFLNAWQMGAKEWREAQAKGLAALFPISEAWTVYAPVGFVSEAAQAQPPDSAALAESCRKTLERYVERRLAPTVAGIDKEMRKEGRTARLLNKLGVAYGTAGLLELAREAFKEANMKEEFAPALMNLGNLSFLSKDFKGALALFERALRKNSQSAKALLAAARANHELENYGQSRELYGKLKAVDPGLAAQFAYLELRGAESGRAASAAGVKEMVVWSE